LVATNRCCLPGEFKEHGAHRNWRLLSFSRTDSKVCVCVRERERKEREREERERDERGEREYELVAVGVSAVGDE
jgi:hypothetical protein